MRAVRKPQVVPGDRRRIASEVQTWRGRVTTVPLSLRQDGAWLLA